MIRTVRMHTMKINRNIIKKTAIPSPTPFFTAWFRALMKIALLPCTTIGSPPSGPKNRVSDVFRAADYGEGCFLLIGDTQVSAGEDIYILAGERVPRVFGDDQNWEYIPRFRILSMNDFLLSTSVFLMMFPWRNMPSFCLIPATVTR